MAQFLKKAGSSERLAMGMVACPLLNTHSDHGAASRGVCGPTPESLLKSVAKHTGIIHAGGRIQGIDASHPS